MECCDSGALSDQKCRVMKPLLGEVKLSMPGCGQDLRDGEAGYLVFVIVLSEIKKPNTVYLNQRFSTTSHRGDCAGWVLLSKVCRCRNGVISL